MSNDENVPISSEIEMAGITLPSMASDEPVNVVPPHGVGDDVNAEMIEETFKAEIDSL